MDWTKLPTFRTGGKRILTKIVAIQSVQCPNNITTMPCKLLQCRIIIVLFVDVLLIHNYHLYELATQWVNSDSPDYKMVRVAGRAAANYCFPGRPTRGLADVSPTHRGEQGWGGTAG